MHARATCDADDMTPDARTAAALSSALCAWIDRLCPDADRAERLRRALDERFGGDARPVTEDLCREVEAVAHDFSRYFELEYVADGSLVPDTEPPGWPPQDPREVQLSAGSVGPVTRRPNGVGVLALDGLDGVNIAAPYLQARSVERRVGQACRSRSSPLHRKYI